MKTDTALCKGGPLHSGTFTYRDLYIPGPLHSGTFAFRDLYIPEPFYTRTFTYRYRSRLLQIYGLFIY